MLDCPLCGSVQVGPEYEHELLTMLAHCIQSDIRKSLPCDHTLDDLANAFDKSDLLNSIYRRIAIIEQAMEKQYAN